MNAVPTQHGVFKLIVYDHWKTLLASSSTTGWSGLELVAVLSGMIANRDSVISVGRAGSRVRSVLTLFITQYWSITYKCPMSVSIKKGLILMSLNHDTVYNRISFKVKELPLTTSTMYNIKDYLSYFLLHSFTHPCALHFCSNNILRNSALDKGVLKSSFVFEPGIRERIPK